MLSLRSYSLSVLVGGLIIAAPHDSHAQSSAQSSAQMAAQQAQQAQQAQHVAQQAAQQATQQAAAAAAQQARERQAQEAKQVRSLLGIDPAAVTTIGLSPGPVIPCKLPKRARPYECQRLLEGPALVLTHLTGEFIVARGDQALAQGQRSWWSDWNGTPLALAPGEILYHVGDSINADKDLVVTIYRSGPPASARVLTPPKPCVPACGDNLLCEDGQCVEPCRPACGESQYCATDRRCYWIRNGRKTADPVASP